jgi:feruloyl-CoA synthase
MRTGPQPTPMSWGNAVFEPCPDGSLRVRNSTELGPYPDRLIERLQYWAAAPDRVLLASHDGEGWRKITYLEALNAARAIGQALLDRGLSLKRPVLILSGNGIEHGLLALACLNVGIPFVPVSTAYSLVSTDFARLRDIAALVQPGLVFADDGDHYAAALLACTPKDAEVVIARGDPDRRATFFDALVATTATDAVESRHEGRRSKTIVGDPRRHRRHNLHRLGCRQRPRAGWRSSVATDIGGRLRVACTYALPHALKAFVISIPSGG